MNQSGSQSRKRSLGTLKCKKPIPYNAEFEQKIINVGVYPKGYQIVDGERPLEPENIHNIRLALAKRRPSLSPSQFSEGAFAHFQEVNERASSKSDVIADVIPVIVGERNELLERSGDVLFTRLEKFDEDLSMPKPGRYYGVRPVQIDPRVRRDLNEYIVPSNRTSLPAAPNFFFEVEGKSAAGRADVAQRQAVYDGAIGARGMLHLQNYGNPALTYDGNAYMISSTYHPSTGALHLYATHPRESQTYDRTDYHMTQLGAYSMTGNIDSFRQGAAAYRNARDWAQQQRNRFVADANAVAQGRTADTTSSSRNAKASVDDEDVPDSDMSMDEPALKYEAKQQRIEK